MADARFREIPVRFRDGCIGTARATGNNAAWLCPCHDPLPLLAASFPPSSHTVCPNANCRKRYQLDPKREFVEELAEGVVHSAGRKVQQKHDGKIQLRSSAFRSSSAHCTASARVWNRRAMTDLPALKIGSVLQRRHSRGSADRDT